MTSELEDLTPPRKYPVETLARLAYAAHCRARSNRNLTGKPLFTWDEMTPHLRESWEAAAAAVREAVESEP